MKEVTKEYVRKFLEKGGVIRRCPTRAALNAFPGISRRRIPVRGGNIAGSGGGCYWSKSLLVKVAD